MTTDCQVCGYVSGAEPAAVVYSDSLVFVMMAPSPANPGHVLIAPSQHVERLSGLSEDAGLHLFKTALRVRQAIENSGINCEGSFLGVVEGDAAFQIVPHLHVDLVPRFRRDRYWMLATIDRPYARPNELLERLVRERTNRRPGEDHRATGTGSDVINDLAAQIRKSYLAIWGGLT